MRSFIFLWLITISRLGQSCTRSILYFVLQGHFPSENLGVSFCYVEDKDMNNAALGVENMKLILKENPNQELTVTVEYSKQGSQVSRII